LGPARISIQTAVDALGEPVSGKQLQK
jgi:hypothetical protein